MSSVGPAPSPLAPRELLSAWSEQMVSLRDIYSAQLLLQALCRCPAYHLLRVTAVLTANDDGSQELGVEEADGRIVPAEPYLRNPVKHKDPDSNYITDWIRTANTQLLLSGACFGLDGARIQYVLEPKTDLHTRWCGDGKNQDTINFINQRAQNPDSPYRDSVILIFRWGRHPSASRPGGQGCTDATRPYILMPGAYREDPLYMDGEPRFGNEALTHEFGHFMGAPHTFPEVANRLQALAEAGNYQRYPLKTENLGYMVGVTEADLEARKQEALDLIATWRGDLDVDTGGYAAAGIPPEYGVMDTPVNLGWGLPLLHGHTACEGAHSYDLARYSASDLEKDPVTDEWTPKPGAVPTIHDTVRIDSTIRGNIMGYWPCAPGHRRFSPDQVKRMTYVLRNNRQSLVGRTISIPRFCLFTTWPYQLPDFLFVRLTQTLWKLVLRMFFRQRWQVLEVFERCIAAPSYWWDGRVQRELLEEMHRTGGS